MPRVALSAEQKREYKLRDFKGWVIMQMKLTGKTQAEVGRALGISQGTVSTMLKIPDRKKPDGRSKPDPFSYGQVLTLCELFGVDGEERQSLLTL